MPNVDLRDKELEEILSALGEVLQDRNQRFAIVVIGGAALVLSGLAPSTRTTKDVDVLALRVSGALAAAEPMPAALLEAADEVGRLYELAPGWLNAGPTGQLEEGLPPDFERDLTERIYGGLSVLVPSRFGQICLKVHAAADPSLPNKHAEDLRGMPDVSTDEIMKAGEWAISIRSRRDPRDRVTRVVEDLLSTE